MKLAFSFKERALNRLKCVLFLADPDAVEVWSGLVTMSLGILWLHPMDTFSGNHIYDLLGRIMSEDLWGSVLVLLGVLKLHAYFLGNLHSRRFCLFGMFLIWMLMSVLVTAAWGKNPSSAAPVLYGANALLIGWGFVRVGISQNTREVLLGSSGTYPRADKKENESGVDKNGSQ